MKLTEEQKQRFAPMLRRTWEAIAPDAEHLLLGEDKEDRVLQIMELVCDANRPEAHGGMSRADYDTLCAVYPLNETQRWLRHVLNY